MINNKKANAKGNESRAYVASTVDMMPSREWIGSRVVSIESGEMVHILSDPSNPEVV